MAEDKELTNKDVGDAFRYVADRLGLGRTISFLYEHTRSDVQMEIGPHKNKKEAPNEWFVGYNARNIVESMRKQDHPASEYIRSLALHEILHAVIWPVKALGLKGLRESDAARLIELDEATVRLLESLLRPLVVKCKCQPKGKKKKLAPTSPPSASTEPKQPTGATSPNMDAANPHASSSMTSSGPSTTSSESMSGEECRSDTRPD